MNPDLIARVQAAAKHPESVAIVVEPQGWFNKILCIFGVGDHPESLACRWEDRYAVANALLDPSLAEAGKIPTSVSFRPVGSPKRNPGSPVPLFQWARISVEYAA